MNVYDYIRELKIGEYFNNTNYEDSSFAYDYNEVQEWFYTKKNDVVFLVGNTGLGKSNILGLLVKSLLTSGKNPKDILLLDYNLPILFNIDVYKILNEFISHDKGQTFYLFINEIHFIAEWLNFLNIVNSTYPNIKLVCTSSASPIVYEKLYEEKLDFIKIIVLSDKNNSNIKTESNGFGIYDDYIKYNIKDDFIEIKGLTDEGKKRNIIKIPEEINGKIVKVIASGAFHHRNELVHINLPNSITMIGDYAFTKCTSLKKIDLPENLEYIGENAFLGAINLKHINVGKKIKHIGNSALYGTKWLEDNSDDYISLGNVLYKYQGKESNIIISENLVSITNWAFSNNHKIECVTIKNDKCIVSEGTFYQCINLKEILGLKGSIKSFVFAFCKSLNYITLKEVEHIGDYAFFMCEKLEQIDLDSTEIGHCAFAYCNNLQIVTGFPKSLEKGTFYNCSILHEINIESTKKIGAFSLFNTSLRMINIKSEYIGDYALANNLAATHISINNKPKLGKAILSNDMSIKELKIGGKYVLAYYFDDLSKINIPKIHIRDEFIVENIMRQYLPLKTLILSDIKKFGRWTFYECKNLKEVIISNGIQEVGDWAFTLCETMHRIELPPTIKKIGMNAFRYCKSLKVIKLNSEEVVSLMVNAFYSANPNKKILVPKMILNEYKNHPIWSEYADNLEGF